MCIVDKRSVSVLFVALVAFATNSELSATELIQNGSFENPGSGSAIVSPGTEQATGWLQINSTGIYMPSTTMTAQHGSFSYHPGHVWGVGGVQQSFATQMGEMYSLSFYANGWQQGIANQMGTVEVGDLTAIFTTQRANTNLTNPNWTLHQYQFTATSDTSTLTFTNNSNGMITDDGNAVSIDNVSVTAISVPEPNQFLLFSVVGVVTITFRRPGAVLANEGRSF